VTAWEDPRVTSVVSPVFVGRRADLQAVADAFAHAQRAEPSVVIVSGEAGVGKTRLVEEAGAAAGSSEQRRVGKE
jgi:tRNA A37 threonylcarbamoyladenosine biosynthesis protein TsaE